MRVSIVATALDGQQPESKSVINMVHRIQNRNPGYHDISVIQKNNNMNSANTNFVASTSGANALKVSNEEIKETENELLNSMVDENMILNSFSKEEAHTEGDNNNIIGEETPLQLEENIENYQNIIDQENSNGLENFELNEESPQLFSTNDETENEVKEENFTNESEEDELEIPAFLRRQKN